MMNTAADITFIAEGRKIPLGLGERLFAVGKKIAKTPTMTIPLLDENEDDIMEGWAERKLDVVAWILGVKEAELLSWQAMRGIERPPDRSVIKPDQDTSYVRFQPADLERPRGQPGACPRCGGYVGMDLDEPFCVNCGHRLGRLEAG